VVSRLGAPGIVVHGVALKPGKPLCLAVIDGKPLAVLPGFPTSAIFTFHAFVAPVIRALAGLPPETARTLEAEVPVRIASELGRKEFVLVALAEGANGTMAFPTAKGSGSVTSFSQADGFLEIDALARLRVEAPEKRQAQRVLAREVTRIVHGEAGLAEAEATTAEFFQGKTVIILVGSQPGGGYDLYARVLAQYLGRHIPGQPAVLVQNMPGAGGLRAARHLTSAASKDGTALGILAQTLPFDTLLGYTSDIQAGAFNWLGRIASNPMAGVTLGQSDIVSIETARKREISIGGSGGTAISTVAPFLLNKLAGTRFKLIAGYQSASEVMLAMERGEVEMVGATGIPIIMAKHAARLRDGTIRLIYQTGQTRHPGIPDVPTIGELGTGSEEKQILDLFAAGSAIHAW
jgi:tripartite-type tricarboxylate transporter receptor subunit TctC